MLLAISRLFRLLAACRQTSRAKAGDLIASINGKSTADMSVDDAVTNIRGKAGNRGKTLIVRAGAPLDFTITRQNLQVPSVEWKTPDGDLGYIRILTFLTTRQTLLQSRHRA